MGLFNSGPSFLNFGGWRGDSEDRRNARDVTGGDPKRFKRNHVMVGLESVREVDAVLSAHGYGIEYAKMLSGVIKHRGDVAAFAQTCTKHDVVPYVGGGFMEDAVRGGTVFGHARKLHDWGINAVEVSNSRGDVPASACAGDIRSLRRDFGTLLVEIGTKIRGGGNLDDWRRDLDVALDNDADAIVLEGAASGRAGVYDGRGWANSVLVTDLAERAGPRADRFLIEAPLPDQRQFWIREMFGWDVRLGNITLDKAALGELDRMRLDAMSPDARAAVAANRDIHRLFLRTLCELCDEERVDPSTAAFQGLHGVTADNIRGDPDWREALRQHLQNLGMPQGMIIRVVDSGMTIEDLLRIMGWL